MHEIVSIQREDRRTLHILKNEKESDKPYIVCWDFDGILGDFGVSYSDLEQAIEAFKHKCITHNFPIDEEHTYYISTNYLKVSESDTISTKINASLQEILQIFKIGDLVNMGLGPDDNFTIITDINCIKKLQG